MTIAIVGQALMLLALCAAVGGAVASAIGGRGLTRDEHDPRALRWAGIGERAGLVLLVSTLVASTLLLIALATGRFEFSYVAGRTNLELPMRFKLTAFWSGQEGSLLLWLTVLALFGQLMLRSCRRAAAPVALRAWATAVLLAVASFFALLVAFVARPFALADTLAQDGAGMSPALQNYWMVIHPPALYLGYVGVTVPFAIVMGALLARRSDDAWVTLTRRWALVSWVGLSIGLLLGGRWAYEEIGWGGYWAWDPVENAALMPWLTTTAFIHSVMVQQRRGMMRYWNVVLVALGFGLSIFGTFLTRSGVLSSVHSFVSSPVGWWFIGFLAIVIVASMFALYQSRELLRARHDLQSVVSRESAFLFNNLLLVAIALTVLWGVLFPILTAAFSAERVSLQAPWYNFFAVAFGLPLLLIMGIGPSVAWQRAELGAVARALRVPLLVAVLVGVTLLAAGLGSSIAGVATVSFGTFVIAGVVAEFARGIAANRRGNPDSTRRAALRHLLVRNRRRYGGYVAHAGVGLLVIAIAGSTAWTTTVERNLDPGESMRVGAYTLTFEGSTRSRTANAMRTRGRFAVRRGERQLGTLLAGKNFYPVSGEVSNEVAIRPGRLGEDLYVVVDRLAEDGSVRVKGIINPLVNLLWLAGAVMVLGSIIAGWPGRTNRPGSGGTPAPLIRTAPDGYKQTNDAVSVLSQRTAAPS